MRIAALFTLIFVILTGLAVPAEKASLLPFDSQVRGLHRTMLADFDNFSFGGFALDYEGTWSRGFLFSNSDSAGIFAGKGSIRSELGLQPKQSIRLMRFFQNADLSSIQAFRMRIKPEAKGIYAAFLLYTGDWKIKTELPSIQLGDGKWNDISVILSSLPEINMQSVNAMGIVFSAPDGYQGNVFADECELFGNRIFPRDSIRAMVSPYAKVKKTDTVVVRINGDKAHGTVSPDLFSFNIATPISGNKFLTEKLRAIAPGIMRMWTFGGYGNQMNFNPAEGVYKWEFLDREVFHLDSIGWEPMFSLGECQKWNTSAGRYVPANFEKWADMAAAIVKHYNIELKLNLRYWEIWSENDIGYWGGTQDEYFALVKTACKKMKAIDPSIQILVGGWASVPMVMKLADRLLQQVPPEGLYDGISWHNYLVSRIAGEKEILESAPMIQKQAKELKDLILVKDPNSKLALAMTEANMNPASLTDWRQETMLAGIYWASVLNGLIIQNALMGTYFQLNGDDNFGAVTDVAKPVFNVVEMLATKADLRGSQWLGAEYDFSLNSDLEVNAFSTESTFSMLIINKSLEGKAHVIRTLFDGLPAIKDILAFQMTDKKREAAPARVGRIGNREISFIAPPFSIVILNGAYKNIRKPAFVADAAIKPEALGLKSSGSWNWKGKPFEIQSIDKKVKLGKELEKAFKRQKGIEILLDSDSGKTLTGSKGFIKMLYDSSNLYLQASVSIGRPALNKNPRASIWNGDCIELYLSSKPSLTSVRRAGKSRYDYQIILSPASDSGNPIAECTNVLMHGINISSHSNQQGYEITAIIPKGLFTENEWSKDAKVRFDASIAVAGKEGNRVFKKFWNAPGDAWNDPDAWGVAIFK